MSKTINLKEELQKKIRECSLSGGEVLRSLDKAVTKLEYFATIMQPLKEVVEKLEEASDTIEKSLIKVKDQAQISREGVLPSQKNIPKYNPN